MRQRVQFGLHLLISQRAIHLLAKAIMAKMDEDSDGKISRKEFIRHSGQPEDLSVAVFSEFDTDGSGDFVIPEYLWVWGRWARGR